MNRNSVSLDANALQRPEAKSRLRGEIQKSALKRYDCSLEHLFKRAPEDGILRRRDNRKWFAVFMNVSRATLNLPGEGRIDVMNVKVDPEMAGMLAGTPGYLPAYHMNKEKWLTILLDGTVSRDNILSLLDGSYELTGPSARGKRRWTGAGRDAGVIRQGD